MRTWFADLDERIRRELAAIALIAASVLLLFALYSDGAGAGTVGGFFQRVLLGLFGRGAPVTVVLMGVAGVVLLVGREVPRLPARAVGALLALAAVLVFVSGDMPDTGFIAAARNGFRGHFGGVIGATLHWLLVRAFGPVGRTLIMAAMALASIPLMLQLPLGRLASAGARGAGRAATGSARALRDFLLEPAGEAAGQELEPEEQDRAGEPQETAGDLAAVEGPPVIHADEGDEDEEAGLDAAPVPARARGGTAAPAAPTAAGGGAGTAEAAAAAAAPGAPVQDQPDGGDAAPRPYRLPPLSLLKKGSPRRPAAESRKEVEARARHLEVTLENFGVKARVVGVQQGPAVTRFELEPATGVRVSRIQSLANDIALSMAATDVRIESPIPGKSLVGIEVPNREISAVYLRDVIDTPEFQKHPSRLAVALGRDIAG
ncbi:MAG: hypothetical protein DIU84_09820, partial [Bacillota bacterium]